MSKFAAVLLLGALAPATALADDFCDTLKSIAAQAPAFAALEGQKFNEADFVGTISFAEAEQCIVRHNYELNADFSPGPDHISYECLWENRAPADLAWLRREVSACYPTARYADGAEYGMGGTYTVGSISIEVNLGDLTHQLWATVKAG